MRNIAFISLAIVVLAVPSTHAATVITTRVEVPYGDLNLVSVQGREMLQWRLRMAARAVCGPAPDIRSSRFRSYQACVSDAAERAMASIGQPMAANAAHRDLPVFDLKGQ
jgi:UrcA family protein